MENFLGFAQILASITKGITLGKFIRWIVSIIIIAAIVLFLYNTFFNVNIFYNKLDRKLIIIEKIQSLSKGDSTIISETHKRIYEIIRNLEPSRNIKMTFPDSNWAVIIKIMGALLLPFLAVIASWRTNDRASLITGAVVLSLVFGVIAVFIPTIYSVWINFIIVPVAEILVLIPFILKQKTG